MRFRRNPEEELHQLEQRYRIDPSSENRLTLVKVFASQGQIDWLNRILEDQERPILDMFNQFKEKGLPRYLNAENVFGRFSFEKIWPEFQLDARRSTSRTSLEIIAYEAEREAHVVSEVAQNFPARSAHFPNTQITLTFLRTSSRYLIRFIETNLDTGNVTSLDYLERPSYGPMFEGWKRFMMLKGETWDVPIETGFGGLTDEESKLIMELEYYGEEINENTIAGLEQEKEFGAIAPGLFRFVINATDGNHEKWFNNRQEAIEHAKKYPGERTGDSSWFDSRFGDRRFHIETLSGEDEITYEEIFGGPAISPRRHCRH